MLILSRKQGQSLIIDEDITVTILSIRNGQIRIGIDAPTTIPVLREELLDPARRTGESQIRKRSSSQGRG